jgi:enoyl-CoA hydratase/carnithine racemase
MPEIEYRLEDGIAHIVLNRPEVLNATTDPMIRQLRDALYQLDDDPNAMVGIISGNGRAFCAGADIKEKLSMPREEVRRLEIPAARDARTSDLMYTYTNWKPVISAVHGYVLGAGVHISLMSDMIVAAEDAKFQVTELKVGRDSTQFWGLLAQRASGAFATDVCLTGRFWDAKEGHERGAVDRLAPVGGHVAAAEELAREIMEMPPLAVRALVEARRGVLAEVELRAKLRRPKHLHSSDDAWEATQAVIEKRKPVFHAR